MILTLARLNEAFECDPEIGILRWKIPRPGFAKKGAVAGALHKKGYWIIKIDGQFYRRSRLIWLYVNGMWPKSILDHRNRNRQDDSISNLREATNAQNQYNNTRCGETGFKGVTRKRNRFSARITIDGKTIHLGHYDSPQEAHAVYAGAAHKNFGEFACPSW